MSTNVKPSEQLEFKGVFTAGNPIQRPRNTAEVCENFRIMPGNYLRLRSGRVLRSAGYPVGGTVLQIAPLVVPLYWGVFYGADSHIVQIVLEDGTVGWYFMLVNCPPNVPEPPGPSYAIIDPDNRAETVVGTHDNDFSAHNQAAYANLPNRPVFYNGLGVRDATNSRPALTTFPNFQIDTQQSPRYFGLDCYVPVGDPPLTTHAAGAGYNTWLTSLNVYVGLWHRETDHFSNGIISMQFPDPPAGGIGTLTVSNLHQLSHAAHVGHDPGHNEEDELFYVFYATIDGGKIPYLILNSTLDGPYAVPITATTASLSIRNNTLEGAENGFTLDLAHEMPTENFPPRPMRTLAFVNGRLYGALLPGGSDAGLGFIPRTFTYVPSDRDMAAVVWSAAAGDNLGSDFLGDPMQSWPYRNIAYTPSGEAPIIVTSSPGLDAVAVLVMTRSSTFLLQEQIDGIHEWTTVSRVHGIANPATVRQTKYGTVWVTQRNQIVLLPIGGGAIQILSDQYQNLIDGTPRCADYILDPITLVDRYQVWMDNRKSVCHDFALESPGVAYTATNQDFTAAYSTVDKAGRTHHILAKTAFYTHEMQPEGTGVPVTDDGVEITGEYVRNWDDFGDADVRKELPMVDLVADGLPAASLGGSSPLSVSWYGDFEQVIPANKKATVGTHLTQSTTSPTFRYKTMAGSRFWYKLVFGLIGHSLENGGVVSKYPALASEGNNSQNFYGMILRALWRLGVSENRA